MIIPQVNRQAHLQTPDVIEAEHSIRVVVRQDDPIKALHIVPDNEGIIGG